MSVYLDMTKQILAATLPRGDPEDELAVRRVLLDASAGTPFWGDDPSAYNTVRFAKNIWLPGQCRLQGKGFAQRLQRDQAAGTHGHKVKQIGIQPAKFRITLRMWTEEHLRTFERFIPLLKQQRYTTTEVTSAVYSERNGALWADESTNRSTLLGVHGFTQPITLNRDASDPPTVTKKVSVPAGPAPLDVYHPLLALFKIRSAHVTEVDFPHPSGDGDVWECDIDCEEFIYRASAVKAAESAVATVDPRFRITEQNPLIGTTAGTLAQKPSAQAKDPFSGTSRGKAW